MNKFRLARIGVGLLLASANIASAHAQNAGEIANLQRLIQAGEQTLQRESYLTQYCNRLSNGDAFLHRALLSAGHDPIVSLTRWDNHLNQRVAAGRLAPDRRDALIQESRRRRNELVNACNLANNRALLAKARQPRQGTSNKISLAWSQDTDANQVLNAEGMVTGTPESWRFEGTDKPPWSGGNEVRVMCTGKSIGIPKNNELNGSLNCRATWRHGTIQHVRDCTGNGVGRGWGYNATKAWFMVLPTHCRGYVTLADGKVKTGWIAGYMIFPIPANSALDFESPR